MRLLLNAAEGEKGYRAPIQSWCRKNGAHMQVTYGEKSYSELHNKAMLYDMQAIIVSCPETFYNLVGKNKGTQQDWAGSVLWEKLPVLLLNPLRQVQTIPEGHFLLHAHLAKLPRITTRKAPEAYPFEIITTRSAAQSALNHLAQAMYIVEDIETSRHNGITSIGFTPLSPSLTIGRTYVFNLSQPELYHLWTYCRDINLLPNYKIFHNGGFDAFHLCRWYMPPRNYILDTEYLWHSWYAELKKSLAFVANTVLWDARYWKYEAEASPLEYNAKDCINTARIFKHILASAPDWAWRNYSKLIPNVAPVVWCAFEGFKVDVDKLGGIRERAEEEKEELLTSLRTMSATPDFNPNSPKQVATWIYQALRAKKPAQRGPKKATTGTDTKTLARVALQHPIYARIISTLQDYRAISKALSTYYTARLTPGGRLLFTLNPDGTETERFSSRASSLYAPLLPSQTPSTQQNYGTQLQNIPPYMKVALCADDGYVLIDIDKNKSEAFCTAKISGDEVFEADLKGELDFYLALGNRLFGLNITDKGHPLRQIFKKINHSASYMAGGDSLLDSIGPANVFKYMTLLGYTGSPKSFADKCIRSLLQTYKKRKEWWDNTRTFAKNFGYIETPDGHHRHVFDYGNRHIPHATLRSLVAHQPQHLSVAGLNEAFWKAWYYVQLESEGEFRLKGQVHDSIVAQVCESKKEEYEKKLLEVMDIPQPTAHGILRIPLESSISKYWKESKT